MEVDIQYYLEMKNMISFTTGLDILQEQKVVLYVFPNNYAKIKVDSHDSLPLKKH